MSSQMIHARCEEACETIQQNPQVQNDMKLLKALISPDAWRIFLRIEAGLSAETTQQQVACYLQGRYDERGNENE